MKHRRWIVLGLALALLATCGLIMAVTGLTAVRLLEAELDMGPFSERARAEVTETRRLPVAGPQALSIENVMGDITVIGEADRTEVTLEIRKAAYGATEAAARARLEMATVEVRQTSEAIRIEVAQPEAVEGRPYRAVAVIFELRVPADTAVRLRTATGAITLTGLGGEADLHTDFGAITVTDHTGGVSGETSVGAVTVQAVQAGEAAIALRADFGDLHLEDAAGGDVRALSSTGRITLVEVTATGEVEARTDFGELTLTNVVAPDYALQSTSGGITVEGAAGQVTARTDFGPITIQQAISVTLDLQTNSGAIDFSGSLGEGPHLVRTDFGAVSLALPQTAALAVDLHTDFGQVRTEFPVTVSGGFTTRGDVTELAGAVNGGGAALTVRASTGDINLSVLAP